MTTSRERFGIALGLAGVLLFGGTLPFTRLAVVAFDPARVSVEKMVEVVRRFGFRASLKRGEGAAPPARR